MGSCGCNGACQAVLIIGSGQRMETILVFINFDTHRVSTASLKSPFTSQHYYTLARMSANDAEKGIPTKYNAREEKTYDDPQAHIWSMYLTEAEKHDKALVESWKGDMDGILIFAGLFSASVTAFIIEAYQNLNPDPADTTVALLAQISKQLAAASEGTHITLPSPSPENASFTLTSSALRVNALWFLSLLLSITCALLATLVQQWSRHYLQAVDRQSAPLRKARIRTYLAEGLNTFGMTAMVEGIPTLLHISLFLFFAGLVDFLFSVNLPIAYMSLAVVTSCGMLYMAATILPTIYRNCPYRTPLTTVFWRIMQGLHLLRFVDDRGNYQNLSGSISHGQMQLAMLESRERVKRDANALHWTLQSINEDSDLAHFFAGLPAFLANSLSLAVQTEHSRSGVTIFVELSSMKGSQLDRHIAQLRQSTRHSHCASYEIQLGRMQIYLDAVYAMFMTDKFAFLSETIVRLEYSHILPFTDWPMSIFVGALWRTVLADQFLVAYQNDLSNGRAISDTQYASYWKFMKHNWPLAAACGIRGQLHFFAKEHDVKLALMNIMSIEPIETAYYMRELSLLLHYLHDSTTPVQASDPLHIVLEILCPIPGDEIDGDEQVRMVRLAFEVIIGKTGDPKLREMPRNITRSLIRIARSFGHTTAIQEAARLVEVYADIACPVGEDRDAFAHETSRLAGQKDVHSMRRTVHRDERKACPPVVVQVFRRIQPTWSDEYEM